MFQNTLMGYIICSKRKKVGGLVMKIEVTQKAKEELKKALETRKGNNKPLRIYVAAYG